jgi:hypothetical protein
LADELCAAPQPGGDDHARLVSCLRGTDTMAALRKVDLISLARGWGYRCSLWRRRRTCSRTTQRALATMRSARGDEGAGGSDGAGGGAGGAGSGSHGALLPRSASAVALAPPGGPSRAAAHASARSLLPLEPFDSRGSSVSTVAQYISSKLGPLSAESARLFRGDEARDTAVVHGWAHITSASCEEIRKVWSYIAARQPRWHEMLDGVRALRATLPAHEVAFRALAGHEATLLPLDALVQQMGAILHRNVAADAARRTSAGLHPAETAWLDELHRGRILALELTARTQALLINAKFGLVSDYLEVCGHVLHLLIGFFQALGASFEARELWMRRLLTIDAGGDASSAAAASAHGRDGGGGRQPLYVSHMPEPTEP